MHTNTTQFDTESTRGKEHFGDCCDQDLGHAVQSYRPVGFYEERYAGLGGFCNCLFGLIERELNPKNRGETWSLGPVHTGSIN